jgi:hypothetical protein
MELIGQMSAGRRSTVTLAAGMLESEGAVRRLDDGSWLITEVGERKVRALAKSAASAPALGEAFMFNRLIGETSAEARAVQAEARQLRGRPAPARD